MATREPGKVERIAADFRSEIERGIRSPGSPMPSVSDLQARHGIASQTAREVYRVLEKDGLVATRHGKGTYVSPFLGKILRDGTSRYQKRARSEGNARGAFQAELARLGLVYVETEPKIVKVRPPKAVAELLGLHHSAKALGRIRAMQAQHPDADEAFVVQLATSWFPGDIAFDTQLEKRDTGAGGSKNRLAELGHAHRYIREELDVRPPTAEEAKALGIPADRQVYELLHVASTAERRVVEVAVHVMPVNTWRFSYSWEIDADQ